MEWIDKNFNVERAVTKTTIDINIEEKVQQLIYSTLTAQEISDREGDNWNDQNDDDKMNMNAESEEGEIEKSRSNCWDITREDRKKPGEDDEGSGKRKVRKNVMLKGMKQDGADGFTDQTADMLTTFNEKVRVNCEQSLKSYGCFSLMQLCRHKY